MKYISAITFFLLSWASLIAQGYSITIKVIDQENSVEISGALIFIDELHFNDTESDEYGVAFYENIPEGKITVNVRKAGYTPYRETVNVTRELKHNTFLIKMLKVPENKKSSDSLGLQRNNAITNSPNAVVVGDNNSGVVMGSNSYLDNSKTYVDNKLRLRTIDEAKAEELERVLKACSGTEITIRIYNEDYESLRLMNSYIRIFDKSGLLTKAPIHLTGDAVTGIGISVPEDFSDCQIKVALGIIENSNPEFGMWFKAIDDERFPELTLHVGSNPENFRKE